MLAAFAMLVLGPVEVEIHHIPPGMRLELPEFGKMACYTFEEYQDLLRLDGELETALSSLEIYKDLDSKYAEIFRRKDEIIQTMQVDREIMISRMKRMEDNWHAAEKLAVEAAGGPWWPYVLAAGGAVVGIVGVTLYVSELAR